MAGVVRFSQGAITQHWEAAKAKSVRGIHQRCAAHQIGAWQVTEHPAFALQRSIPLQKNLQAIVFVEFLKTGTVSAKESPSAILFLDG